MNKLLLAISGVAFVLASTLLGIGVMPAPAAAAVPDRSMSALTVDVDYGVSGEATITVTVDDSFRHGKAAGADNLRLYLVRVIPDDGFGEGGAVEATRVFDRKTLPYSTTFTVDRSAEYEISFDAQRGTDPITSVQVYYESQLVFIEL